FGSERPAVSVDRRPRRSNRPGGTASRHERERREGLRRVWRDRAALGGRLLQGRPPLQVGGRNLQQASVGLWSVGARGGGGCSGAGQLDRSHQAWRSILALSGSSHSPPFSSPPASP